MSRPNVKLLPLIRRRFWRIAEFTAGSLLLVTELGWAHQVQIAETVGGTLHLEPNDTPQAQIEILLWIALTRQGGEPIPLSDCLCSLSIYAESSGRSLAQPTLQPVSAEGYTAMPGTTYTFPAVGAYRLVLTGSPKGGAEFSPFELTYPVIVAAGPRADNPAPTPTATSTPTPEVAPSPQPPVRWLGVGLVGLLLGIGIGWVRRRS